MSPNTPYLTEIRISVKGVLANTRWAIPGLSLALGDEGRKCRTEEKFIYKTRIWSKLTSTYWMWVVGHSSSHGLVSTLFFSPSIWNYFHFFNMLSLADQITRGLANGKYMKLYDITGHISLLCLFNKHFICLHLFSHLDYNLSKGSILSSFISPAYYLIKIDIQKYFWLHL